MIANDRVSTWEYRVGDLRYESLQQKPAHSYTISHHT